MVGEGGAVIELINGNKKNASSAIIPGRVPGFVVVFIKFLPMVKVTNHYLVIVQYTIIQLLRASCGFTLKTAIF